MTKKYDLDNFMEFGRVAFALGLSDVGYKKLPEDKQALIASGWDLEYKRNKVRMLKRYEGKRVPKELQFADQPCINTRGNGIDKVKFNTLKMRYGYVGRS